MVTSGTVLVEASDKVIETGKQIAAHVLEALPSVMNALFDALPEFGMRHIDMPVPWSVCAEQS